MSKAKWLMIINPLLLLLVIVQGISGFTRDYFPEWVFKFAHIGTGCALIVLALLHLALNWSWVRANFFKRKTGKPAKVTADQ